MAEDTEINEPTVPEQAESPKSSTDETPFPKIKHIIMSGGGAYGLAFYGVLRESQKAGFWKYDNIKTVYGISIGALVATMVLLTKKLSWELLDNYWLKRPWQHIIQFNVETLIHSFHTKGLFDKHIVEKIMLPMFNAVDISIDITLAEFYREFPIELHFISTEMTQSQVVDFNYKTHPEWKLIDALYCSVCLPVFFSPYELDGKVYLDGGVFCNVPTAQCIANGAAPDEIFTIIACANPNIASVKNTDVAFSHIIEFMLWLIGKIWRQAMNDAVQVPHTIYVHMATEYINIYEMFEFAKSPEVRQRILDEGIDKWTKFITDYKESFHTTINSVDDSNSAD